MGYQPPIPSSTAFVCKSFPTVADFRVPLLFVRPAFVPEGCSAWAPWTLRPCWLVTQVAERPSPGQVPWFRDENAEKLGSLLQSCERQKAPTFVLSALPPKLLFSASSQEERGLLPSSALGSFDGDKCKEVTNGRACWSEVMGKRDANTWSHFSLCLVSSLMTRNTH